MSSKLHFLEGDMFQSRLIGRCIMVKAASYCVGDQIVFKNLRSRSGNLIRLEIIHVFKPPESTVKPEKMKLIVKKL